MKKNQPLPYLNGLSPADFLRDYWQKKPLLIRNTCSAFAGFAAPLTKAEVIELAGREEAESRLITLRGNTWNLQHGPFNAKDFRAAKDAKWTVLIQDTQHVSFEAHDLLAKFNFIPTARVDDLMVSLANDGGSVGPHFDSYDVFLLQGEGKRRWQISTQKDLSVKAGVPLKILAKFKPEQEWILETGDMLYLPPHVAHYGVAVGECMTWSIGFRAPDKQELSAAFLDFLRDELAVSGAYVDRDLSPSSLPGQIDAAMEQRFSAMLKDVRASANDHVLFRRFLGCYLSEPKAHVMFDPPDRALSATGFLKAMLKHGLYLDLKARVLFLGAQFFVNGQMVETSPATVAAWKSLANTRRAAASMMKAVSAPNVQSLYASYCAGYLHIAHI
jgi:50S ribosomal protein L16 3-hydroxylase